MRIQWSFILGKFVLLRGASILVSAIFAALVLIDSTQAQTLEQSASYVSQIDEDLTIRKVAILPLTDNVDGIYARPLETQLTELIKSSHRWDHVETNIVGSIPALAELEENPDEVKRVTKDLPADAFLMGTASRGPSGVSIRITLFLKKDGKVLAQEILRDHPRFEIPELREQVTQLYRKLIRKIPYDGLILSRQQNRVTINLGRADGLKKNQIVTAVQILAINRHPKFHFVISSEKAILGQIRILKVDDTLSFGALLSEKEPGAVQKYAKIAGLEDVKYTTPSSLSAGESESSLIERPDAPVTFGKDPKEWLPVRPPSFGQVGFKVGLGRYSTSVNLESENLEGNSSVYPSLGVHGELWLNPYWTVRAELTQGVISTSNPLGGSTPGTLSHSLTKYSLAVGYNFLLQDDFFGPKLQLSTGVGSTRTFVDDSQPRSLTTTTYSGLLIGLSGSFPVSKERDWYLGGTLNLYLMPKLSESPESSGGDPKNTINDFSFFVEKKVAENLWATASLDFALYSTSFGAAGPRTPVATSLSQRHSNLTGGITYQF